MSIDVDRLREIIRAGGGLLTHEELTTLVAAHVALQELIACRRDGEAINAELNAVPYTADDIKFDRARSTVPPALRERVNAIGPRLDVAWEAARKALA